MLLAWLMPNKSLAMKYKVSGITKCFYKKPDFESSTDIDLRPIILVIDKEAIQAETICLGLSLYGCRCIRVEDERQAVEQIDALTDLSNAAALIDVTDHPDWKKNLIERLRSERPNLPIMALVGLQTNRAISELQDMGVMLMQKPFNPENLDRNIRALIVSHSAKSTGDASHASASNQLKPS
jgi:DNA-binding response OmpR family regulator